MMRTIHITQEDYDEINEDILRAVENVEENTTTREVIEVHSDNGVVIRLEIAIRSESSSMKFTDYAWGYTKTFTEYNYRCSVDVVDVIVTKNGKNRKSDFDERNLEHQFENTVWK